MPDLSPQRLPAPPRDADPLGRQRRLRARSTTVEYYALFDTIINTYRLIRLRRARHPHRRGGGDRQVCAESSCVMASQLASPSPRPSRAGCASPTSADRASATRSRCSKAQGQEHPGRAPAASSTACRVDDGRNGARPRSPLRCAPALRPLLVLTEEDDRPRLRRGGLYDDEAGVDVRVSSAPGEASIAPASRKTNRPPSTGSPTAPAITIAPDSWCLAIAAR